MRITSRIPLLVSLCSLLVLAHTSTADVSWGPRVGVSSGPDQVLLGAQFDAGNIWQNTRFAPNVQAGIGDDVVALGGAAALHYVFSQDSGRWDPYAGGELGVVHYDQDRGRFPDHEDTELGVSAAGGLEKRLADGDRLNFELRLGFVDAQDMQFHVGRTF